MMDELEEPDPIDEELADYSHLDLFELIRHGDIEGVQEALQEDPSLANIKENSGVSAIMTAVYYNQPAIARLIEKYREGLDLFEAAALGETEIVRTWVTEHPELVNAYSEDGFQPLGLAAFFGQLDVATELLKHGAEIASPSINPLKVMPLHSAVAGNWLELPKLLIQAGAPVNAQQSEGFTPLHSAAQNGNLEIITCLFEAGADVNARESEGRTPLYYTEKEGYPEAEVYLKKMGAKLELE